jgi:hypothetical protein
LRRALCLLLCLLAAPAPASDGVDEALEGFDDEEEAAGEPAPAASGSERSWRISGELNVAASFGIQHGSPDSGEPDFRGLNKLRTGTRLRLDVDLPRDWRARAGVHAFYDWAYPIKGADEYRDEVLDEYREEVELDEAWIAGALLEDLDLKFGRQVVAWGRSENLRVLDVLNPVDNREPAIVDLDDLRLPVVMTRLDYHWRAWRLTGVAIHEWREDKQPVRGSEFYPFPFPEPGEDRPANGGSDTEYALALEGVFSGWDVSLHFAHVFDDRLHFEPIAGPPGIESGHSRISMYGASGALALGSWLLKGEAAHFFGMEYFATGGDDRRRSDVMLGLEYTGLGWGANSLVSLDVLNRHVHDWDSGMDDAPDFTRRDSLEATLRYSARYSADFRRETLHLIALGAAFGRWARDGALLRVSLDYDLTDAVTVGGGLLIYEDGDLPPFSAWDSNDRLYMRASYRF